MPRPDSPGRPTRVRLVLLVGLALSGFAANSLLCRIALGAAGSIDPVSFTAIRIAAGAMTLVLLSGPHRAIRHASLLGTLALFAYAIAFSLAYVRIGAGPGALVLFAAVQVTMLGRSIVQGEHPGPRTWLGMILALGGIAWLVSPGFAAPDPLGAILMAGAGFAWGAYSLLGRRSAEDPLGATAGNFVGALLPAAASVFVWWLVAEPHVEFSGAGLAVASGALASGVAYAIWYTALPSLDSARAGIVQLLVPILAAAAAVPLLDEPTSFRLVGAGVVVFAGVMLALTWTNSAGRETVAR